jgi:hypothetical protein
MLARRRLGMEMARSVVSGASLTLTASLAVVMLQAAPAHALGNNRVVSRSCGTNWIASGFNGSYFWAETSRNSGTCQGRLSVAIQRSDGFRTVRHYGTSSGAFMTTTPGQLGGSARYGVHWGCNACRASLT